MTEIIYQISRKTDKSEYHFVITKNKEHYFNTEYGANPEDFPELTKGDIFISYKNHIKPLWVEEFLDVDNNGSVYIYSIRHACYGYVPSEILEFSKEIK